MKMGTNKDDKTSAAEHGAVAKKMFETMDANKDGKVTAKEMEVAQQHVSVRKATKSDMSAADRSKSLTLTAGIVTAEEHACGARAMFEKMDLNKDGFLSKEELVAGHASMKNKPSR